MPKGFTTPAYELIHIYCGVCLPLHTELNGIAEQQGAEWVTQIRVSRQGRIWLRRPTDRTWYK